MILDKEGKLLLDETYEVLNPAVLIFDVDIVLISLAGADTFGPPCILPEPLSAIGRIPYPAVPKRTGWRFFKTATNVKSVTHNESFPQLFKLRRNFSASQLRSEATSLSER
jgi:hypothetical protein